MPFQPTLLALFLPLQAVTTANPTESTAVLDPGLMLLRRTDLKINPHQKKQQT